MMNEPRWISREECLVLHEMMRPLIRPAATFSPKGEGRFALGGLEQVTAFSGEFVTITEKFT